MPVTRPTARQIDNKTLAPFYTNSTIYASCAMGSNISGGTSFTHTIRTYYPFEMFEDRTFTKLVYNVLTPAASGNKLRVGVYARGNNSIIGSLLFDSGLQQIDTAAQVDATISLALTRGHYFIAMHTQAAVTLASASLLGTHAMGRINASATLIHNCYGCFETKTFGAMDAVGTLTMNSSALAPQILFR